MEAGFMMFPATNFNERRIKITAEEQVLFHRQK